MTSEHPKKLLVVDDDQEIRELLAVYLQKNGFTVAVAAEGNAMRHLMARNRPSCFFLATRLRTCVVGWVLIFP